MRKARVYLVDMVESSDLVRFDQPSAQNLWISNLMSATQEEAAFPLSSVLSLNIPLIGNIQAVA